ncbi:MAG: PilT/PilU family type 4a pilus ATPase [Nitrospiraceae bacterium]|nr:MAG: PilT/PilU family type 4a pilus ATPase [Nitrospiraceae bacterium]
MEKLVRKHKPRIGEILLDYGLVSQEQLATALDMQIQGGGRLGSIFEEMGCVDSEMLSHILGKQYNLPFVNLFHVEVPSEILRLVPFEQVRTYKVLPVNKSDNTVSLAMVDPNDGNAIRSVEFAAGGTVKPFIVPSSQMDKAIALFETEGYGDTAFEGNKLRDEKEISVASGAPDLRILLRLLVDFKAAGLHLAAGAQPGLKVNNELKRLPMPKVSPAQMKDFISEILGSEQREQFEREKEFNLVLSLSDIGRFGINIYKQRNSISLSARLIVENIPSADVLQLPDWLPDYALKRDGLVLIAGLPGNGKTATMSALVDVINSGRKCNIVSLEEPIEYLHRHKMSNVNQREIGIDTDSFASGLKHILRQDPDVIAISELRDAESIASALNAAETGRLILAAVTAPDTTSAISKIINLFPQHQQPQIRMQLADTLLVVFAQRLIPVKEGRSVLAYEKLLNSSRVRNMVSEAKITNMRSLMQIASEDMLSMDRCLARLCLDGRITFEDGLRFADVPSYYQDLIRTGSI